MTDTQLIEKMARVWVDSGGDVEGIDYCYQKLKEAVIAETESRVTTEQEQE